MNTRLWIGLVALASTLTWLAPATANAQARRRYPYEPGQSGQVSGVAYDNGYREGVVNGERDARSGRSYSYNRDGAYQRADAGYGGYGDRDAYRTTFRQGYEQGYREGYGRFANEGRYGRNGGVYDPRYGYPVVPYPGGYGYPGTYARIGYDRGFNDGLDEGRNAGRGSDRYDPQREKDYRNGDAGYDKRYGTKDAYKQSYRDGFLAGYERGYRENERYSSRSLWPW